MSQEAQPFQANFKECDVCCLYSDKFISCLYCQASACEKCHQTFILDQFQDKCMFCAKTWNFEFMQKNFREGWLDKTYKDKKKVILFEREKAMLPATQEEMKIDEEKEKKDMKIKHLMKKLSFYRDSVKKVEKDKKMKSEHKMDELDAIIRAAEKIQEKIRVLQDEKSVLEVMEPVAPKATHPCSKNECRGFLITEEKEYKCGICSTPHCKKCRCEKEDEHKCDPNTLETIKMMDKETKPCPKCSIPIYKISGCFSENTEILMYDGSIKIAQDISIGDVLVGDDGLPRHVIDLCRGVDKMYTVKQNNGVEYTVNSKHSLVLKSNIHKTIRQSENGVSKVYYVEDKKVKSKTFNTAEEANEFLNTKKDEDNTIHITVEEYLKKIEESKSYANQFHGFKSSGIVWGRKDVGVDPYLLGLWLGDGCSNGLYISSNDNEVVSFLLDWCDQNDCELVHSDAYKFSIRRRGVGHRQAIGYGSSTTNCNGCKKKLCELCDSERIPVASTPHQIKNPFKESLESYGLINNKHIPQDFLCNDEQTRLSLLAGLIDSDGWVNHEGKRTVISNTNQVLVKQIELLARSLGFVVNTRKMERKNVVVFGQKAKDYKDIFQINISGNLSKIPTLIKRKQMNDSEPNKDYRVTSITIEYKETSNYFGWKVDDNTRFLLPDLTVVKNCDQMYCTGCHTAFSWRTGRVETGMIHNPHYWEYLREQGRDVEELNRLHGQAPNPQANQNACLTINDVMAVAGGPSFEVTRILTNIREYELPKLTAQVNNKDVRVRYLTNEIDEKNFKMVLYKREKKHNFNTDLSQILTMVYDASQDVLVKMYRDSVIYPTLRRNTNSFEKQFHRDRDELLKICMYAIEEVEKLSARYNYVVPVSVDRTLKELLSNL